MSPRLGLARCTGGGAPKLPCLPPDLIVPSLTTVASQHESSGCSGSPGIADGRHEAGRISSTSTGSVQLEQPQQRAERELLFSSKLHSRSAYRRRMLGGSEPPVRLTDRGDTVAKAVPMTQGSEQRQQPSDVALFLSLFWMSWPAPGREAQGNKASARRAPNPRDTSRLAAARRGLHCCCAPTYLRPIFDRS